jgi:hypothetical protein
MSFNDVKVLITVGGTDGDASIECDGIDIFLVHKDEKLMIADSELYDMILHKIRMSA